MATFDSVSVRNINLYVWFPDSSSPATHVVEAKRRTDCFDLSYKLHLFIIIDNIYIYIYFGRSCFFVPETWKCDQ